MQLTAVTDFLSTDTGFAAVFSVVGTLAAVLLTNLLQGKVNLIWFSPNSTHFTVQIPQNPNQPLQINSGRIVIQNFGRKSAEDVQITSVPGIIPAGYSLVPNVVHSTEVGPNNEWIVKMPFIAPKEVITLQILNGPFIASVRSKDGAGKLVPVRHQRLFPAWVNVVVATFMLLGILATFFAVGWIISSLH